MKNHWLAVTVLFLVAGAWGATGGWAAMGGCGGIAWGGIACGGMACGCGYAG